MIYIDWHQANILPQCATASTATVKPRLWNAWLLKHLCLLWLWLTYLNKTIPSTKMPPRNEPALVWFHQIHTCILDRGWLKNTITSAPSPSLPQDHCRTIPQGSLDPIGLLGAPASAKKLFLEVQLHEGRLAVLRVIRHHVPMKLGTAWSFTEDTFGYGNWWKSCWSCGNCANHVPRLGPSARFLSHLQVEGVTGTTSVAASGASGTLPGAPERPDFEGRRSKAHRNPLEGRVPGSKKSKHQPLVTNNWLITLMLYYMKYIKIL